MPVRKERDRLHWTKNKLICPSNVAKSADHCTVRGAPKLYAIAKIAAGSEHRSVGGIGDGCDRSDVASCEPGNIGPRALRPSTWPGQRCEDEEAADLNRCLHRS